MVVTTVGAKLRRVGPACARQRRRRRRDASVVRAEGYHSGWNARAKLWKIGISVVDEGELCALRISNPRSTLFENEFWYVLPSMRPLFVGGSAATRSN